MKFVGSYSHHVKVNGLNYVLNVDEFKMVIEYALIRVGSALPCRVGRFNKKQYLSMSVVDFVKCSLKFD